MNKQEAMTLLKKQGYKITKRREAILIFFAKEDKYHSAKNLYEYMEAKYPGISYDTVYRNLHLYHDLGILESTELQAEKHFRMACTTDHNHHFICNDCGATTKINICPMDDVKLNLANYYIAGHKFEV